MLRKKKGRLPRAALPRDASIGRGTKAGSGLTVRWDLLLGRGPETAFGLNAGRRRRLALGPPSTKPWLGFLRISLNGYYRFPLLGKLYWVVYFYKLC